MGRTNTRRPNVMVVMCDQLRFDVFSYFNHPVMRTPNLDRLVAQGVLFSDAICTYPLCGPSRAAMLTGCFSYDDAYVPRNREPGEGDAIREDVLTVDEALDRAGYHVEYHGKWHTGNGHRECYKGRNVLFGHKIGCYHDYLAARYEPPTGAGYRLERYTRWPYRPWPVEDILSREASEHYNIYHRNHFGVMEVADEDTLTAYTVRQTVDFLNNCPPEPFAVTCSILHPHLPYTPNRTYADMYDPADMAMPGNIYAHYYEPLSLQPGKTRPVPELLPEGKDGLGQCISLYLALVKEIDDWFGRLMDALERGGYKENTLVIFASDHGHLLGNHNALEKFQYYEESIRIPLIMSYPGEMPSSVRTIAPATGADIAPTILDYCSVEPLKQFHGRSLRAVIDAGDVERAVPPGKNPGDQQWAFCENEGGYSCFRSHEWKVVYDPQGAPAMVFNLTDDPGEFVNLLDAGPAASGADGGNGLRAKELSRQLRSRIPQTTNSYWKHL